MKISICNELFQGWPIERIFDYAAQLGYGGVELAPFTLAESVTDISMAERKRISKAAESAGVEIVGLHWLLVKPEGLSINHPAQGVDPFLWRSRCKGARPRVAQTADGSGGMGSVRSLEAGAPDLGDLCKDVGKARGFLLPGTPIPGRHQLHQYGG
jgi:hypothetical protein